MTTISPLDARETSSPPVSVEVLLLRQEPTGELTYRRLTAGLGGDAGPDRTARRLARLDDGELHLVHSTSWRAAGDGRIVLTYLVHPDTDPLSPGIRLDEPFGIARSARPGDPAPPHLEIAHVVAHAVRHLAFLGRTDPVVAAHLAVWPQLRRTLRAVPGVTAGELRPLQGAG